MRVIGDPAVQEHKDLIDKAPLQPHSRVLIGRVDNYSIYKIKVCLGDKRPTPPEIFVSLIPVATGVAMNEKISFSPLTTCSRAPCFPNCPELSKRWMVPEPPLSTSGQLQTVLFTVGSGLWRATLIPYPSRKS